MPAPAGIENRDVSGKGEPRDASVGTVSGHDLGLRRDDGAGPVLTIPDGLRHSALVPSDCTLRLITGPLPVIPIRQAQRLSASGWPAQARP
jgi:hypothetical protein